MDRLLLCYVSRNIEHDKHTTRVRHYWELLDVRMMESLRLTWWCARCRGRCYLISPQCHCLYLLATGCSLSTCAACWPASWFPKFGLATAGDIPMVWLGLGRVGNTHPVHLYQLVFPAVELKHTTKLLIVINFIRWTRSKFLFYRKWIEWMSVWGVCKQVILAGCLIYRSAHRFQPGALS